MKGTPPQSTELDQSELRVLKDLASSFLKVDMSQLEALLHAREASLPDINADGVKPSKPSGTVGLRFRLGGARPASEPRPSVPSAFDAGPRATPQRPSKSPTPTRSMGSAGDPSSGTNQTDSSRPSNTSNKGRAPTFVTQAFDNARIAGSNIDHESRGTNFQFLSGQEFNDYSRSRGSNYRFLGRNNHSKNKGTTTRFVNQEFNNATIDRSTINNRSNHSSSLSDDTPSNLDVLFDTLDSLF